jgi:hypothetical protein
MSSGRVPVEIIIGGHRSEALKLLHEGHPQDARFKDWPVLVYIAEVREASRQLFASAGYAAVVQIPVFFAFRNRGKSNFFPKRITKTE